MQELPQKLKISVFIIARNEEDRIPLTIKSVIDWVDEVIVIDSGSDDKTVEVSEQLGARVIFNEWQGYGQQKVFGETLCKNDWILNIDADEEITPELRDEILEAFSKNQSDSIAYRLKISFLYPGQSKLPLFPIGTTQVRLYRKDQAGFKDSSVHDSVVLKEGVKEQKLKGHVLHRNFRSHEDNIRKVNEYSSMLAEDLYKKGRKPGGLRIIIEPFFAFFKCYVLKRHFVNGLAGYQHSWIYAGGRVLRLAKARELFEKNKTKV